MQLLWCKAASCGKVAWKETKVTGILLELHETLVYKLNTVEVLMVRKLMFFVMGLRLSDHKVLDDIASSSSFFRFRSDFNTLFARILYPLYSPTMD